MTDYPRDMCGYGPRPPEANWPGRARTAVQFVINYEEGGENCVLHGDSASEAFLSEIVGAEAIEGARHMNMESLYEYGSRAGFWRLHRIFTEFGMPVTVFGVAMALARNPGAVAAMQEAGWEIASHGYRWVDYQHVDEATERAHMAKAIEIHEQVTGERPSGWYLGRCSPNSHRLAAEDGGFVYNADSLRGRLAVLGLARAASRSSWCPTRWTPTICASRLRRDSTRARSSIDYLKDTFKALHAEGGRMMSVGLHCRLAGRPGRAAAVRKFLDSCCETR